MVSKLKAVDPKSASPSKPKILIFGKPGVNKTWVSLDFPSDYYIDTEGGANRPAYTDKLKESGGSYFGVEQGSTSFSNVIEEVKTLAAVKHDFKTLVIDSVSKVFATEISEEAERLGDKDAFGASKKPAVGYMRRLVSWLTKIDMNVILISHEKVEWTQGEQTGTTFDAWDKLEYELDLVLNIFEQAGKSKARVVKSRIAGFTKSEVFDWSYDAFAEKYGRDIMEGDVKPIELATEAQLTTVNDLIGRVKLPEGQVTKWFKAAKCESFEEMEADKLSKIIDYINKTFIKTEEKKEKVS